MSDSTTPTVLPDDYRNEWEEEMLALFLDKGALGACRHAFAGGVKWACEQAGHPMQDTGDTRCICGRHEHGPAR